MRNFTFILMLIYITSTTAFASKTDSYNQSKSDSNCQDNNMECRLYQQVKQQFPDLSLREIKKRGDLIETIEQGYLYRKNKIEDNENEPRNKEMTLIGYFLPQWLYTLFKK